MKRHKLMKNPGLKIMAFIFAVFLWLIVVNLDNPVESTRFSDVSVTIVNDDIITSAGDVYQVVGEQTVSVLVYANRKVCDSLKTEDIVATADIKEMDTSTGLVPVKIEIPNYSGEYESAVATPRNLQIQREKSGKKVFSLTIDTVGTQRDGYIPGKITVNPEKITVTGAESVLDQIDRVVARVKIEDLWQDSKVKAEELIFYDKNGNAMNQTQLETNLGEDGVTATVEMLKKKTVSVVFSASGTPASGHQYTGYIAEPETVQICGKSDIVDEVEKIEIPSSVLDVSGISESIEKTVDITPYLPDGISLVDENTANIKVTALIEQDGTRTINFLVSSIKIKNLAENLQVSYEPDAEITLKFVGDESKLKTLDISNGVSVDLDQYTTPGTYNVPVRVELPDGITMSENVTVNLTIEQKEVHDSSEDQTGSDSGGSQEEKQDP